MRHEDHTRDYMFFITIVQTSSVKFFTDNFLAQYYRVLLILYLPDSKKVAAL